MQIFRHAARRGLAIRYIFPLAGHKERYLAQNNTNLRLLCAALYPLQ
ncbi:hypothetical protein GJA_1570 [Janthinobacterium agaricidamnosum NBRC 102515 = DSM 9628]|uniref:Uncharacterized protein n=1 Tax=Janthinobacterium agaricidamnosum NBRC 102515 = DSM 9628 TaxID=1349767 RepID=W0V058_9BURK|nr:hypothetical protein GJA_1570 [Janthinobacterium agaricidamnosum NBRC 102515 = DSM 9628]